MSKYITMQEIRDVAEKALVQNIAPLVVLGDSYRNISKKLGIKESQARRLMASEECVALIKAIGNDAFNTAISMLRAGARDRLVKAFSVLDKHLDEGNLNAAVLVFKTIDKEVKAPENQADTNITIVMPGSREPIKVQGEVIDAVQDKED